ncbi:MAG: hypothetical protein KIT57_23675 [Blastocatellales bacterium]|nr:hypothetical protein [Blastocatellales bacterium]
MKPKSRKSSIFSSVPSFFVCSVISLFCLNIVCIDSTASLAPGISSSLPAAVAQSSGQKGKEVQQFAIDLIKDAGAQAAQLEDQKSAAQIRIAAAEALAHHDRDAAGDLYRSAFDAAFEWYRTVKDLTRDPVTRLTTVSPEDFCRDIIRRITAFDADLGRAASAAFDKELDKPAKADAAQQTRRLGLRSHFGDSAFSNEIMKASSMLRADQRGAIELAKKLLAQRFVWQGHEFLWILARQDRNAADELFLWLLANLLEDKYADPFQLQVLAVYPFGNKMFVLTDGFNHIGGPSFIPERIREARDPGSERILIDWFIEVSHAVLLRIALQDLTGYSDQANRIGAAAYIAQWLEPHVTRMRPDLMPSWREISARLSARLQPEQAALIASLPGREAKLIEELNLESRLEPEDARTRIKRLMDAAGNERDAARADYLYHSAAAEADRIGDRSLALELAEKISSPEFRLQTRDWIFFNASSQAIREGRPEAARRDAAEISAPDERTSLYCALARAALAEKDKIGAGQLLDEAETRALDAPDSPAKVRALVMIAVLFGRFDAYRAFQVVSTAVATVNETPEYRTSDAKPSRSISHAAGRKYALVHQAEDANLDAALAMIAQKDFDGAIQLAQTLKDLRLKLSATIRVAAFALLPARSNPSPEKPPEK